MGLFDESKDSVKLSVIAGKKNFGGAVGFSNILTLKQHSSGAVYVSGVDGPQVYTIVDYQWDGPEYKSVTTTKNVTKTSGDSNHIEHTKEKTKRTGRVTGAVAGTLIFPGPGTIIGAMVGTGNKKTKGKTIGRERHGETSTQRGTTSTKNIEVQGTAYMTLHNLKTGETFTFSFRCDSKLHVTVTNMLYKAGLT